MKIQVNTILLKRFDHIVVHISLKKDYVLVLSAFKKKRACKHHVGLKIIQSLSTHYHEW